MARHKKVGLAAIAEAAGVTAATVSNAINHPAKVSEKTKARVYEAMSRLDFVPNQAAATLRQGHNRLIGVLVPEVVNAFYAQIVESISLKASQNGYMLALCVTHDQESLEVQNLEMLAEQRAAGVIMLPRSSADSQLDRLRMVGARFVLIDRTASSNEGCSVSVDDIHGGQLAAHHLLTVAGSTVALVNGPLSIPQCRDRRLGVLDAFRRAAIDSSSLTEISCSHMTVNEGIRAGRLLAQASPLPRGVFCTNDFLAAGVVRGLRQEGLQVPRDIHVVGYGNLDFAGGDELGLTTVAQPMSEMGERAVELLLAEIVESPNHSHSSTVLAPSLILRASSPRSDDSIDAVI